MTRFVDSIELEVAEEKAGTLGRTGQRLEDAVAELREHDLAAGARAARELLLWNLAERVEALLVQREACGLRDSRAVVDFYSVPREALARVGARRPSSATRAKRATSA